MAIRQWVLIFFLQIVTSAVSAGVVKVDLNEGVINPGQTIIISLDELEPAQKYTLSCVLTSQNSSGKVYNLVHVATPTNTSLIGVNAPETSPGSHQYKLPTSHNSYLYGNIYKNIGDISITNLDNSDAVLLSSCHAVGRI